MSTTQQPQPQAVRGQGKPQRQGMGKLIALGVVAVLIVIYIVQNTEDVAVKFLFWSFTWPAWLMLILMLVIGFLVGMATSAVLRRRKKRELRRRAISE